MNLAKPVENMSGLSFAPESNQINILLKESEAYFRTIMSFYIVTSTFCKAICNNKKKTITVMRIIIENKKGKTTDLYNDSFSHSI